MTDRAQRIPALHLRHLVLDEAEGEGRLSVVADEDNEKPRRHYDTPTYVHSSSSKRDLVAVAVCSVGLVDLPVFGILRDHTETFSL